MTDTTATKTFRMEPKVYALIWSSDWAGDVPADRILEASFDRESLEGKERDTYDGVYAASQGKITLHELDQPKSITTLIRKGADIDVCKDDMFVGCWFDGKPYAKLVDRFNGWKWNAQSERDYLEACRLASGFRNYNQ